MIFVTGGFAQGKLTYVLKRYGYDMSDVFDFRSGTADEYNGEKVVNHFEEAVAFWLEKGKDPFEELKAFTGSECGTVIISQETGCGLVPADAGERKIREVTGRVNCILSSEASEVIRVFCGLGMKIKG